MKKFKINGISVKADSIADAIHQVKDSDLLKQMAYKLADMASYFDRANAPHSRNQFQQQEYEKKLTETYTYGLKVYEQLKKEINAMNSSNSIGKGGWRNTETVDLLKDAGHNIYWAAGDVYPRKSHIQTFGRKLEDLANEYQQKLDDLYSEYIRNQRNQRNDSEEVEDLATVDKTFLLTLTRKIISNITSDNFTAAQTQAKELERYINNVRYADSVDDSVNDSWAMDIVRQLPKNARLDDIKKACKEYLDELDRKYPNAIRNKDKEYNDLFTDVLYLLHNWNDSVNDMPDLETRSGRKQYYLQIAMSALDVLPTRKWNMSGDKINIDNNKLTFVVTEDGIMVYEANKSPMKYTNKTALQRKISEVVD